MNKPANQTKSYLPLLSNQRRLWIFSQQEKTNPAYNLQLTYHFGGVVDYDVLNQSLRLLFERHSTMFSVFKEKDGDPYIEIIPRTVSAEFIDFSNFPVESRREKIFEYAGEDSRRCFDIETGPLFRIYLLKENDESFFFHATIHHLIFDGWSRRLFVHELSTFYSALVSSTEVSLEPLSYQSYDFAAREADLLDQRQEKELAEFWQETLKECPSELKLPCDNPRKAFASGLGCRESFEVAKEYTSGLKEIGKQTGSSLFNVVVSLLGVLFQKYSGEDDICIGVPVSNRRNFPLSENVFGLFVNTSVVRLKVNTGNSFRNHVEYAIRVIKEAIVKSKLPFDKIVEAVKPERIPGINPLFQVSLSWMTDMTIPMNFGGIKGERVILPDGVSPFDITFYMWEDEDVIRGDIEYNIDIFNPDTIIRLKESLILLAQSLSYDPDKELSGISAISEIELQRLESFNKTDVEIPDCLIQNLFEQQANEHPARTAVISGNMTLTYRDLNEQANQLSAHLISKGVTTGDTVGICLERSADMVVAIFGVLKAGCCYLPMDPSFPDDRIMYMFEDSGARILITEGMHRGRFGQISDKTVVLMDLDREEISRHRISGHQLQINGQSPAYIIYTSGSTGKPKGVKVHHQAVVNLIGSMATKPGIKPDDILLAVITLSFDMSVYELFVTLSKGASLVVAGSQDVTEGPALIDLIERHKVTLIQGTPSFWSILLSSGWQGRKDIKALCGGEALTYSLIRQILPKVGEFWNCYGPTETTVYSACFRVTDENAPILIGKPINNTSIYILDKENNLLPVGVTGEVAIGGSGVTRGYHNRPELTAEKFFRMRNGETVYRTGDLGRFLTDGNIELFGRADNQIKLRGFRIEPGEIETLLAKLKAVRESVVKIHHFDENDERLVAFINAESDFSMTDEEIKSLLAQHLPAYMVPSFIQISDEFPRLPNGKINKKALIFNQQGAEKRQAVDFTSLTETQKKLLTIWESILKAPMINLTDSFFDAGGNSLLGIRLINQINETFGISLIFRELVVSSSLVQLGDLIDSKTAGKANAIELIHLTETQKLPLTRNQKRLWLISKLQPNEPLYVIRSTFKFKGSLNREIFEKSLNILFHRHHIVFSVIKEEDNEPFIRIVPSNINLVFKDLSVLPEKERSESFAEVFHGDSIQGFDLEEGPLCRLFLIKSAEDEHYFHVSIHHIIFDGWSQGVFVNDLTEIYNSLLGGRDISLAPLEFQQYDYALWERGQAESQESVAFWKETLSGCSPVLDFPYDFPRGEQTTGRGGLETITIPGELSEELRRISKETGTSLFTLLLSAYGLLMSRYSGEDDINIGMPVAYRPHTKLEKIFGMFVNTVVVRFKYEAGISFRELVKASDETVMDAISHQDLPFESVVELIKPERISGANPLFQIAFAWQNNLSVPIKLDGLQSEVVKGDQRAATFDITLALWENEDIIQGEIEYNMDIIKSDTIARLKDHFLTMIGNLVKDINKPVNEVPMISEKEIKMILEVNKTATDYPKDKTVVQLFEEQVKMQPEHIAIAFKGESYTYSQLNKRSNQLARTLRSVGVVANSPVGLYADKSLEMIVSLLAILKAGGCYAPIDPEYPQQRFSFIIRDAAIKVILVQNKYSGIEIDDVITLDINSEKTYTTDDSDLSAINTPEDLTYILYTSGTTGIPKGTPIPHQGAVRLTRNTNYFPITSLDNVLMAGAIVFDATGLEVWGTLLNGGSLYIIDKDTLLNTDVLNEEITKNKITTFITTSALFTQIAESRTDIFKNLKYLIVGGDVLSALHVKKVRKVNNQLKVINAYGPTENACTSTAYFIEDDFESNIPIGKPVSNSKAYVFDKHLNYQPVGICGELYVGGDGLASGYLNRPDLNAKCFIDNPHNPGERLYKTGDLTCLLSDGNIEFRGRVDNQLKIRGFRVELEEIESVLTELDDVIEAVVKPVKVDQGDYRLVAFMNVPETYQTETGEVLAKIKAKLPAYMIPSAFKYMNGFPKTINGKIDRKALAFDIKELGEERTLDLNKLTTTEKRIYDIWREILKADIRSLTDSFFDIGGNSLMGLRLINLFREAFGVTLTFKELVGNSTISQMASLIDSRTGALEKGIELAHTTVMTDLPLTANQKRLWLISKMDPDTPSYIIPYTYKLNGNLNYEVLQKSIEKLFHRHYIVFAVLKEKDGEPYYDIIPTEVNFQFFDYTALSEEGKSKKVEEILEADSSKVFDLEKGPLYRLYLIKTTTDEHYIHISLHHIIFDGWSWSVFVNDLNEIYTSLLKGKETELPELEYQEYDFAQWEISNAGTERERQSIEFWEDTLKGCSPVLNFPYDYQRSDNPANRGSHETIHLSHSLTDELKRLSKAEGLSLFTTLFSAFGVQLHKYSGEDDLNIGLWVANRPHTKLENIFGMFVNTIVSRLQYSKGQSFKDIMHLSHEVALNAIAHQDLSFDKVVNIVNPERTSNVNPLFQVVFAWQDNLGVDIKLDGIRSELVSKRERTTAFDLTLSLWENDGCIQGIMEYSLDVLKQSTIIRMRDNFVYLLEALVRNPEQVISDFSIVSENDRKLLAAFNNTQVSIPECLVHNLIEEQSTLLPLKRAVTSGDTSLTYKELNERSNQLARHLLSMGVSSGDVVGISLERTIEMVVSVVGVFKAGCCYLPMDPSFPDERLIYMFEDSGAKILISQDSLKDKFGQISTPVVLIDSDREKIRTYSIENPNLSINSQSLAYVIYTSGSTGRPKGVKVHHQAVVNFLRSMSKEPGISGDDRLLAVTTLSFDISVLELFLPLFNGAELIVAESDDVIDGQKLKSLLDKHDITMLQGTPATWNLLLAEGWDGKKNLTALCGGEAIAPSLVRELLPRVAELWNMYGPTETTVWSTCYNITDADAPVIVGKPIDNTTIYILDKNNKELPVGVIGEVGIGGMGVTKGYHNRPELTAEKFIQFDSSEIVYKTGDQGRFLEDGNIELLGRIDNQIKLRGFRIEPGEIETLLMGLPNVREAVVKVHRFDEKDERLVAFLNAESEYSLTKEQIVVSLSQKLPTYMIPSFYQVSDGFPRLPNGKINKKALILDIKETTEGQEIDLGSLTETQRKLMVIWQDILRMKTISLSDSFFSIGGNSLLVVSLINKIKEQLGVVLTFKDVITYPAITMIADLIDNQKAQKEEAIKLIHLPGTKGLPLTANQKRLWLISKLHPDTPTYIIPYTYKFTGRLDRGLFQKSFEVIFNRHNIIFSVVREVNGEPCCDIVPSPVNISFYDFSDLPEEKRIEKVNDVLNQDVRTVFDLEHGPLYRIYLMRTGDEEHYLRLSIHHIVFDAWSWSVLAKDLNEVYNSLTVEREYSLKDIEFQQYDYAHWEKSADGSANEDKLKEFWKESLKESPSLLNFPYDFPRVEQSSGRSKSETIRISPDLTERIRRISKNENSSVFATMLSAFGILMQKYSGEEDLNIGLPVAYRPHSKLENIFGMFVNTVVVRLKLSNESTFKTVIHQTRDAALDAIAHQDLPFEKIVEAVNPVRSSNANPLFQVGFTWQHFLDKPLKLNGLKSERLKGEEGSTVFDISVYMWENGDQIEGEIEYNLDLLQRETMIRLKTNFINLIHSLTQDTDKPLGEMSFLSEEDLRLINEVNDTDNPYEHTLCIHQKFESIVRKNPDLTALLVKDRTLSYKELDEHSNRMANYLIGKGVGVEDKVGICIDRSIEMMIGIFGTLKAGAAYVPLSPENPTDRLRSIINDAKPKIILTGNTSAANIPEECEKVFIDDILNKPLSDNPANPAVKMSSKNLAYILYTSGSTGTPKGVMIEHHSVLNRLGWMQKAYPIDSTDTLLQKTPITFDVSVWELFWWSFTGAKLVLLPRGGEKDPETLTDYIADFRVTTIHFVPSMFATFFETLVTKDLCGKLVNMNRIFLSGEALPLKQVKDFNEKRRSYKMPDLINLYGPTEATVDVSYYTCPRDNIKNVYIGKPIDNTKLFVVNGKNIIQPIGVPGELLITGVNLARGYINRPELTGEKFFSFNISDGHSVRAYHTGDLVRLTPEGEIDYLGRMDNQVKIRGFRIELGEIEAKILEHPMVTHCAVIVIDKGQYKHLVAYVCLKPGSERDASQIRAYLSDKLPDYMVPPYVIFMDNLPLTSSGKLNRKNLPSPDSVLERASIVKPSNKNEEVLFGLWKDLLKIENISVNDNFFDIGGNSLLAINLANIISKEFNVPLKTLMIFEYPSIKAQSEYLSGNNGGDLSARNTEIDEKAKSKRNVSFKRLRE